MSGAVAVEAEPPGAGAPELFVAADVGGTFTDFVVFDPERGATTSFKLFTTYPDRAGALLAGLARVADGRRVRPLRLSFAHGSTVATNALVELRGARTGLLTTRGFRDLLELRRQKRPHLYDLQADKPEPLVPRALRLEVDERMLHDGRVWRPLDEDGVRTAAADLVAAGVEAVAVVYLHAYANPAHERRTRELLLEVAPGLEVSLSSEVMPRFREFERLSTTVVNAYVAPVVRRYLRRLGTGLREAGVEAAPLVMKSDGSVATPTEAAAVAVATIGSGPAGGVRGAIAAARLALGVEDGGRAREAVDLITFDMGGTSTDVALVLGGEPIVADQREVGGWPIQGSAVDVVSIGAGGGSIAWVDAGGLLRVGPESAGSDPGPACYGRGGDRPTITDAHLLLGRLDTLLGGALKLDREAAAAAVERWVATPLALTVEDACHGILAVVEAHMEQALRLLTVERGHDPRGFTLVAFGGAGGLHAPAVAAALGVRRVLVPGDAGVLSALGVLGSDLGREWSVTRLQGLGDAAGAAVAQEMLAGLRAEARAWCRAQGIALADVTLVASVDVRCHGQNFELSVPAGTVNAADGGTAPPDTAGFVDGLAKGFHLAHERRYGYAFRGAPIEAVSYRVRATAPGPATGVQRLARTGAGPSAAPARSRVVAWRRGAAASATPVLRHDQIGREALRGPALVERPDATIAVPPGQRVRGAGGGGLWIEVTP